MRYLKIFYSNIHGQKREQNRLGKASEKQKIKVGEFSRNRKNPWKHWVFKGSVGGEDGIRTHVRLLANWFRVSPVMTTSIPLRISVLPTHKSLYHTVAENAIVNFIFILTMCRITIEVLQQEKKDSNWEPKVLQLSYHTKKQQGDSQLLWTV